MRVAREPRVQPDRHGRRARAGEHADEQVQPVAGAQADGVPGPHPALAQTVGRRRDAVGERDGGERPVRAGRQVQAGGGGGDGPPPDRAVQDVQHGARAARVGPHRRPAPLLDHHGPPRPQVVGEQVSGEHGVGTHSVGTHGVGARTAGEVLADLRARRHRRLLLPGRGGRVVQRASCYHVPRVPQAQRRSGSRHPVTPGCSTRRGEATTRRDRQRPARRSRHLPSAVVPPRPRVVVTGVGCLSPLGLDARTTWTAVRDGACGVAPLLALPDGSPAPPRVRAAGALPPLDLAAVLGPRPARTLDRYAALAVLAAREATASAGLVPAQRPERVGVVLGTGLGGLGVHEQGARVHERRGPSRVSPYLAAAVIANAAAAAVSRDLDCRGPCLAPVSACASGTDAVGLAADAVRLGRADAVLAGAADASLTATLLASLAASGAVAAGSGPDASRPLSADRDGLVPAEGAAVLVLEERDAALARGAEALAEVVGYGSACDAHHVTAPAPDGRGAAAAVRAALADAGVAPQAVDVVNAHATGTLAGDASEAAALRAVFAGGRVPPVCATKGATGHLMGAAGALEAVLCVKSLAEGVLPPTLHRTPDPSLGLDVVDVAREVPDLDVVLSTSFGFGGHDAALLLRRC